MKYSKTINNMALWDVNGEIVYSDGALSITEPEMNLWVKRHYYKVPYSNVGSGGILKSSEKTYHTPSWTEVHPKTTVNDILVEKKPFEELFTSNVGNEPPNEPPYEPRKFTSATSDKIYTVKLGRNGFHCDCMGYIAHRKCKHIKQATEEWDI
tara:strand:- start:2021 stop:2479 length:459 start_codon:yes stop_codon:yes gene_type:complete